MATLRGSNQFAIAVGVFFFVEGVWGLLSPTVFGVLTTNSVRAAVHLALGGMTIVAGVKGFERSALRVVGSIAVAVGTLRFIPGVDDLIVGVLAVNVPAALLNLVIGLSCLSVSATLYPSRRRLVRPT